MPNDDLNIWLQEHPEIETVFGCVCDLNGTLRGKRLPAEQAAKVLSGGLRMPLSILNVDVWGEDIERNELVFETGDSGLLPSKGDKFKFSSLKRSDFPGAVHLEQLLDGTTFPILGLLP